MLVNARSRNTSATMTEPSEISQDKKERGEENAVKIHGDQLLRRAEELPKVDKREYRVAASCDRRLVLPLSW
jgi:hypothetical protein